MSGGYYIVAFSSSYTHFFWAQIFSALGMAMIVTVEFSLILGYCRTKKQQTLAYSMVFAVFTLFNGVGMLLGGFLPTWLPPGKTEYQSTLFVMAVILTLTGLARFLFLPPDENNKKEAVGKASFSLRLPSKPVMLFIGCSFLIGMAFSLTVPFLNIIVKFRLDWSDSSIATLLTINELILFISNLLTPYLLEKWGFNRASTFVFFLTGIFSLSLMVMLPMSGFILLLLFRNGMLVSLSNIIEGQAMQKTPDENRSVFGGLRQVGRGIGSTIGAYGAGIILAQKDYYSPFLWTGIVVIVTFIYFRIWVFPLLTDKKTNVPSHPTNSESIS